MLSGVHNPDSGLAQDLTIGSSVFLGREKYKPGLLGHVYGSDQRAQVASCPAL